VPVAEFVLGKQRILEIYLNVVEWALVFMAQSRVSLLRRNRTPKYGKRSGGTARCNSASSPEATTRAHE
jgi:hypothetical protein